MEAGHDLTLARGGRIFRLSSTVAEEIRLHLGGNGNVERRGLLFGAQGPECEILATRKLEPDAPGDASFEDIARFGRLLHDPPADPRSGRKLEPVGWYASRSSRALTLTNRDRRFHDSLFGDKDLVLFCPPMSNGGIQFVSGRDQPVQNPSKWSGLWPVAAATIFALLCITASVALKPPADLAQDHRAPVLTKPVSSPNAAPARFRTEQTTSELAFEMARNRRLEATLRILRERNVHRSSSAEGVGNRTKR